MSNEINHERRRFFGAAAMTLAAAQFGLVRSASAQSKAAGPPAVNTGEFFPGFSTELVETSGTTIHVLRKGAGRPLLLLHGYPETHLTWHKVAPQLAEHFSVVVPDLRGYGDSGKPKDGARVQLRSTLLVRISERPRTSTWKWTRPTKRPAERSNVHFMSSGVQRIQSAPCGTCLLLGERKAPHR